MASRKRVTEPRGLPSLHEARLERRRAFVAGRVRVRAMPPQFWLWTLLGLAAFVVVYWKFAEGELESQKSAVMAKQRAMAQSLGPQILPFRDKVEGWVLGLAAPWKSDHVAAGVRHAELAQAPTVYLRLRAANATNSDAVRAAAVRSLHDGFTSCFFIRKNVAAPEQGASCASPSDCEPGLLCNEYDRCSPPPEPFNMRLAYRSLRVLSNVWTDELHQATSDLKVTAFDRDLDRVTQQDVPIAAKILARSKYFVAVLDEDPEAGVPEQVDGGAESAEERVQRVPHFARVGVWEIASGKEILRLRRRAEARAVPVGDRAVAPVETRQAEQRQVISCALAMEVKAALSPPDTQASADAGTPAAADAGAAPSPQPDAAP